MPEHLSRTQVAFEECKTHLQETKAAGSPVESYLAGHILVLLCADMEQALYRIATRRAQRATDSLLQTFVSNASPRILRSVQKGEIADFLGSFGPDCKTRFNGALEDRDVTRYNNAVQNRHKAAHGQGSTTAFLELQAIINAAHKILDSAENSLM